MPRQREEATARAHFWRDARCPLTHLYRKLSTGCTRSVPQGAGGARALCGDPVWTPGPSLAVHAPPSIVDMQSSSSELAMLDVTNSSSPSLPPPPPPPGGDDFRWTAGTASREQGGQAALPLAWPLAEKLFSPFSQRAAAAALLPHRLPSASSCSSWQVGRHGCRLSGERARARCGFGCSSYHGWPLVCAGVAEIGGGWLVWQSVRLHKGWWMALVGAVVLFIYGLVPCAQPVDNFGRVGGWLPWGGATGQGRWDGRGRRSGNTEASLSTGFLWSKDVAAPTKSSKAGRRLLRRLGGEEEGGRCHARGPGWAACAASQPRPCATRALPPPLPKPPPPLLCTRAGVCRLRLLLHRPLIPVGLGGGWGAARHRWAAVKGEGARLGEASRERSPPPLCVAPGSLRMLTMAILWSHASEASFPTSLSSPAS